MFVLTVYLLLYVCVCVCVCVWSVDSWHKTPNYLLIVRWHRSAQCSSLCVCCLRWQKSAQCSCLCICYMRVLSVVTEISTVFLSVYMLHACVLCVDRNQHSVPVCVYVTCVCCLCWQISAQCSCLCIGYMRGDRDSTVFLCMYMLHVCVVCVDRDQHSVPVPKQLHQPFWTPEWGRDKAECAELPGLPEGWHTTNHQPWTQGKLTWPGLPDWLVTNPGHKVNGPNLPYLKDGTRLITNPWTQGKLTFKLAYLKDTGFITSPGLG